MRICVYGAGAVGGSLAVRLARAGAEVSVIARGAHAQAIRRDGLTLHAGTHRLDARLRCVGHPDELGIQDLVIVAVKGPQLEAIAEPIRSLIAPSTRVVFAMNGIPWWFARDLPIQAPEALLEKLDPGGRMRGAVPYEQTAAAVMHSSNEVVEPGVILNSTPKRNRIILGRADGTRDSRLDDLCRLLCRAGYHASLTHGIREALWCKMLLVIGASPVCVLGGATMQEVVNDPECRSVVAQVMREGVAVGERLGFSMDVDIDAWLDLYVDKPVRPSLLQDFEAGREPELGNGLLACRAIAAAADVPVPAMNVVAALISLKAARLPG